MSFLSVSDAARLLGVKTRDVSDLFYSRILSDELCPVVANRRLIPFSYIPEVKRALAERGKNSGQTEMQSA